MFKESLGKLIAEAEKGKGLLKKDDYKILETLHSKKSQTEYKLGKSTGISHSTLTEKLVKLESCGLVMTSKDKSGHTRYSITPIGSSLLVIREKITLPQAMAEVLKSPDGLPEILAAFQPDMMEILAKNPPWFVTQPTPDLRIVYEVDSYPSLIEQTIGLALAFSKEEKRPLKIRPEFKVKSICCRQRMEIKGETRADCIKQRTRCEYESEKLLTCPLLVRQMQRELEKPKNLH